MSRSLAGRIGSALGLAVVLSLLAAAPARAAEARAGTYRGWQALTLGNGLVKVQVVPVAGGRVMQYQLGDFEFLWVNDQLAGKEPPATGLAPDGGWLNYGGDKLWPAPQGWDNDEQWPGPPDAVLDGSPHAAAVVTAAAPGGDAAVRLTSREDPRSGLQFSRVIRVFDGSSRVSFDSTMKNIDRKPRRWSIWQVTQLNAANRQGPGYNPELRCFTPINPASIYPRGYTEQFGLVNNPQFKADPPKHMAVAHYQRLVGKIGVDSAAGWCATIDGTAGYAFVERFTHYPDRKYPDDTSVTYWMSGPGQFVTGTKVNTCKDDPLETPYLVESEVVSPLATLQPGQSYAFHLDWYATRVGGNYPAVDCTTAGLTCVPLTARRRDGKLDLAGRFGVFHVGQAEVVYLDAAGGVCGQMALPAGVSPREPLVLALQEAAPAAAVQVVLRLRGPDGKALGELARAKIEP